MRAIVIGGAGPIGSHMVDALIEHGDTVTAIDNLSSGHTARLPRGYEWVAGGRSARAAR